jgi:pre-mRNA cleavage complex 2 protein Pcf11
MSIDHIGVLHQVCPQSNFVWTRLDFSSQLRSLVNQGVSQDELKNILDTLRNLAKQQPPVIQPQPVPAPVPQWPSSAHPPHPLPDSGSFQAPPPPSDLPSVNILGLLDNLKKAGLLSSSGTPVNQSTSEPALDSRDLERESVRAYRLSILSQSVPLTTAGLTRCVTCTHRTIAPYPFFRAMARIPALLYDRLPSQCKQCGQRFSDSATGKKELDDHLDMHFRQNRKASQDIGRGHSRSWFVTVDVSLTSLPFLNQQSNSIL